MADAAVAADLDEPLDVHRHLAAQIALDTVVLLDIGRQVADLIRGLRPEVVLTFDPFGAYGHPDHIAMHQATLDAFKGLGEDERPSKLYFHTIPYPAWRWAIRLMPLFGADPERAGKNHDINLREILEHEIPITTRIDISAVYDIKQRAAACHSSQLSGPGSIWGRLPSALVRRLQSTETFHRFVPSFQPGEPMERDLFTGIGDRQMNPS